jgi:hypothetical protein
MAKVLFIFFNLLWNHDENPATPGLLSVKLGIITHTDRYGIAGTKLGWELRIINVGCEGSWHWNNGYGAATFVEGVAVLGAVAAIVVIIQILRVDFNLDMGLVQLNIDSTTLLPIRKVHSHYDSYSDESL